jgi:hypothetical protein
VRRRPRSLEAYVALLGVAAALVLAQLGRANVDWWSVAILAALYLGAEAQFSQLWHDRVALTLSSIVIMAALIIVGPVPSTVVALMSAFVPLHSPLLKRVYNTAQMVLCTYVAGQVYVFIDGPVGELAGRNFPSMLVPVLAMQVAYVLVNALLLSVVIRLDAGVPLWSFLRGVLMPSASAQLGYGLFGLLLATLWLSDVGKAAALLLLLPLAIARWVYAQYAAEKEAYEATMRTLVQAVETKDLYTRGHSERVAHGCMLTARSLRMREDRVESLRYAGLLHDLGKIGVPTRILQKAGRLEDGELAAVQMHPVRGVEMVREIDFLDEARRGILHHHERVDGLGYPMGLRGEAIPEFARVIAVADAFDAMTTVRSYRGARSVEEACEQLRRGRGTQFDPGMVDAFLQGLDRDGWQVPEPPVVPVPGPRAGGQPAAGEEGVRAGVDHDDPGMSLPAVRPMPPGDLP